MSILVLPPQIRDQIAAGEVVERPASVVKELVENAVDAGAKNIEIFLEDGGKTKIEVRDDGHGMTPQDAEKSVLRHATSKIKKISDLFSIQSFGFRGEALAAISSISNFELTTKPASQDLATRVQIRSGKTEKTQQAAANAGTRILVQDLVLHDAGAARIPQIRRQRILGVHQRNFWTRAVAPRNWVSGFQFRKTGF